MLCTCLQDMQSLLPPAPLRVLGVSRQEVEPVVHGQLHSLLVFYLRLICNLKISDALAA